MPNFDISIELRGEVDAAGDYRRLRKMMNEHGFRHNIVDKTGMHYWLPRDVFSYQGFLTRYEIMDKVHDLLTEFLPAPGVMVTESSGRCWRGLEKINLT